MRRISFFIALFFIFNYGFSQSEDTAIAIVYYQYAQVTDTNNLSGFYKENMVLYLGKNSSVFKSREKEIQDSIFQNNYGANPGSLYGSKHVSTNEYFKFYKQNKLISLRRLLNNYIIEDSIPQIKWTLLNDKKILHGFACQKAIGGFKGRTYEVWFTAEIPVSNGPWKLGGLPGLIIEAQDIKKQVIFKFSGYTRYPRNDKMIVLPKNAIKTTEAKFARLLDAAMENPAVFLQNSPNLNGKFTITSMPKPAKLKKPNNPIELTKQ